MIRIDIKRTKIYKEMSPEERERFFYTKRGKYIHKIDNIYFSVKLKGDTVTENCITENKNIQNMIDDLILMKEELIEKRSDIVFFNMTMYKKRHDMYDLCLSMENEYDILFSRSIPNDKTNRIHVQLRAIGLWVYGEKEMLRRAKRSLKMLLDAYGIKMDGEFKENRIDYCFHTNTIQNPNKFFADNKLDINLKTQFEDEWKHRKKTGKKKEIDYLALGSRKSNCLYFRIYNKTKEVIEQQYKGLMLHVWEKENLISEYDKIIYEKCYEKGSYRQIVVEMCKFYIEHGKDPELKKEVKEKLKKLNTNLVALEKWVEEKKIVPRPTMVMNIEYETKRTFYRQAEQFISLFHTNEEDPQLKRLFKILDNRKYFIDYLTSNTVAFKNGDCYMEFWRKLRTLNIKVNTEYTEGLENEKIRQYARNIDLKRMEKKLQGDLATIGFYLNGKMHEDMEEDLWDAFSLFNDNDVNPDNRPEGRIFWSEEYGDIKHKKYKSIKALLNNRSDQ